jgi:hypothetical protein
MQQLLCFSYVFQFDFFMNFDRTLGTIFGFDISCYERNISYWFILVQRREMFLDFVRDGTKIVTVTFLGGYQRVFFPKIF